MSLLVNKLSALAPGSAVRLTHISGRIIEGIVAENDNKESLSVQITSLATLRYDQISLMDETALPVTADIHSPASAPEIMEVSWDKDSVSQIFKTLESDEKKELNQAFAKYQGFISSHDTDKCKESINMILNIINEKHWEFSPGVNLLLGIMQLSSGDVKEAVNSFFYAGNYRYAYCTAFNATKETNDKELYRLAASFSAMYLTGKDLQHAEEAAEVLRKSTVAVSDTGGIEYALKNAFPETEKIIRNIIASLGEIYIKNKAELNNTNALLAKLKSHYAVNAITGMINKYLKKLPKHITKNNDGVPDTTIAHIGQLVSYNIFEGSGKITAFDGSQYEFEIAAVEDVSLRNQLKKLTSKDFEPIPVNFMLKKNFSKYEAVAIYRGYKKAVEEDTSINAANQHYSAKNYLKAINVYKQNLDGPNRSNAFYRIIICYFALINEQNNQEYLSELSELVDKYASEVELNHKTLDALYSYYYKINDYENALRMLSALIDLCAPDEYNRILQYTYIKAVCYRNLDNHQSAVSELLDWLKIVKQYKITNKHSTRDTTIYYILADSYFQIGDHENAQKYAELCTAQERKDEILQKLQAVSGETDTQNTEDMPDDNFKDEDDDEEEIAPEPEESLLAAYAGYKDSAGFDALGLDDTHIISKAMSFSADNIHCLLTYLSSAASLSADSLKTRVNEAGEEVYVGQTIKAVNELVSYALNSPLTEPEHLSTEIIAVYNEAQNAIPDTAPAMFAASALYSLFNTPAAPDYTIEDFSVLIEDMFPEQYPSLIPLVNDLIFFRTNTGYGMDSFSSYKTDSTALNNAVTAADECRNALDKRLKAYEKYVQLRYTREILFGDSLGDLRKCLNIAADNDISGFDTVVKIMQDNFIRSGLPVSSKNIDKIRVKDYIDRKYKDASGQVVKEGYQPSKQFQKLVGKRANNLLLSTIRAITCICDWVSASANMTVNSNSYAADMYTETAPRVTAELQSIIQYCEEHIAENGFDWGTESLRRAACELIAKMNGTYNSKERRYLFVDFLRGEDVLLNDNFLPEMQSTFCNMPDFNILCRIERHASHQHPELHERLTEILSEVESKHNFRCARLIREYGEDMGISQITEHKDLAQFGECLKQARNQFETILQEFSEEMKLCESYGTLLNFNGEKDEIMAIALEWCRITRLTGDFGFYVRLLETIRHSISVNAAKKGEQLMRQLNELADDPDINFGVFSKEMIEAKINDQNFSSAEFILSRIISGDVGAISDYSSEPRGYFEEFINEFATNFRASRNPGRSLAGAILDYSGKKDLEKALIHLTNNVRKETKGGANLLKNWMPLGGPANTEQLTSLLNRLGFRIETIQPADSIGVEAYNVFCRKQTGKVNYPHNIPAFGSKSETDGFRVICLYGTYTCDSLMDKFKAVNTSAKHTIVLLDYSMNLEERRRLARKIKEEKSFAKTFIVIDRIIMYYLAIHYAENTVIRRLMAVTLPFAWYQPFVEESWQNMPPELFTGREAELTSIESPEGACLVYGGRQLGKSALLKMAKHNIDKNSNGDRAVLIEVKDRTAAETASIVCRQLIIEGILDESCQCDTWTELAGHLQLRLMDDDPETRINYLLLMLDEADTFIKTSGDTEDQPITALKSLPSYRFKLVMAGLHNLSRYNRELTHGNSNLIHMSHVIVKQFCREEATKLLTNILSYLGFYFTQNIIDNILASTYNYPGLIQFYCQKLLEAMKNGDYAGYAELSSPPYMVTESHYKKVLADTAFTDKVNEKLEATLFTEEKGRSNYHIIALILAYLYYAEPNEKGYTSADIIKVAEEYHINRILSLKPEQLSELLSEMRDLNVITIMDDHFRFATDGFRKLLGSQENVEKSMGDYFEEVLTV